MTEPTSNPPASSVPNQDPYFLLKECRALLERRLTEIASRAGIGSSVLVKEVATAAGEMHDSLATETHRDGFETADGLTASRMTLMCDADLELDIRIGDITRRLADHCANPLWRTHQRYISLLRRPDMPPSANPVGIEALAAGMWAMCNAIDGSHERKFELLNRFEEILTLELNSMYEEINDLLDGRGVSPAQTQIIQSPSSARYDLGAPGVNALAALQTAIGSQYGAPVGFMSAPGAPNPVAGGGANVALSAATLVMLNQLTARLEQLQFSGGGGGNTGPESETRPKALRAADLDLPPGNPESVALETLGLIFEAIFNIWDLPDTVKTALSRLQIPLLRLALSDNTLFSNEQHPARRLINLMGRAALGLPRDVSRAHPVSSHLWRIASSASESFHGDIAVLDAPISELGTMIGDRDKEILAGAQPFIEHLAALEQESVNAELARRWLEETASQPSAGEVHEFLRLYWVQVMELAAMIGGETGKLWQEAAATATELMWSVQPKTSPEDRKRLAALVPGLIRRINAGLDQIGISQEARKSSLDAFFNLQTAGLRGTPPPMVTPSAEETASAVLASSLNAVPTSESVGGSTLHWLSAEEEGASSYRPGGALFPIGQWVQISHESGEPFVGIVCWTGARTGVSLVCNPDWHFALAATWPYLDRARREGSVQIVSTRAIFDLAAQQALNQLARR